MDRQKGGIKTASLSSALLKATLLVTALLIFALLFGWVASHLRSQDYRDCMAVADAAHWPANRCDHLL